MGQAVHHDGNLVAAGFGIKEVILVANIVVPGEALRAREFIQGIKNEERVREIG